ncbi:TPA: hypothetical protein LVL09_004838 [Klebsiella oxytoca]|nr:hypothetical protein [Klebsiella oxytoca]
MNTEKMRNFLLDNGFSKVRQLEDGTWVGVLKLAYTTSVCVDIEEISPFRYRWCFENPAEADYFFETVKDYREIPARRESLRGHRYRDEPLLREKDEFGFDKW